MTNDADTLIGILEKKHKLSSQDLQQLREIPRNTWVFGTHIREFAEARMRVELIDAIRSLDATSSRLMWVAIVVTIAMSSVQIIAAILLRR